jgi:hypothetical protein
MEARMLRVTGEGAAERAPDRFVVMAALNAMEPSAAEALTKVTQLVGAAAAIVEAHGLPPGALETKNLQLHDWFDQQHQRVTARVASYELEVTLDSVDELGRLVAALGAQVGDGLQLRGIRPGIAEPEALYRLAQERAVAVARSRAQVLAASAGVTLGAVMSIEEQRMLGAQVMPMSRSFAAAGGQVVVPPVPFEEGTLSVRAMVTLVYAIE